VLPSSTPFAQYSHAVEVPTGRMVFASGQLGVAADDTVPSRHQVKTRISLNRSFSVFLNSPATNET